ncbi:DMT family transporter [Pseudomonas sp. NPDC089401]|uniref:DMT family transporter n=1 Tax=Pseudomonas sp. NPDC089401 TaxID=3364462 RepID=UPI0037FD53D0
MRGANSVQKTNEQSWLLIAATIFSLIAFAANSVFCRLALRSGDIDADSFTVIRLLGGALVLLPLYFKPSKTSSSSGTWRGGFYLFVYAYLFSLAYVQLDAGGGALILFGAVQMTMFALGMRGGEKLQIWVVLGMLMAFSGLVVLLAPGGSAPDLESALFMAVSGIAWGCYSVLGKRSESPAQDTAGNFLRSLPPMVVVAAIGLAKASLHITPTGAIYAVASGVLASGAGYVVWYAVVKRIRAQTAATLQLSVPVLASIAGVVLLSEPLSARMVAASLIVLGGIALALLGAKR